MTVLKNIMLENMWIKTASLCFVLLRRAIYFQCITIFSYIWTHPINILLQGFSAAQIQRRSPRVPLVCWQICGQRRLGFNAAHMQRGETQRHKVNKDEQGCLVKKKKNTWRSYPIKAVSSVFEEYFELSSQCQCFCLSPQVVGLRPLESEGKALLAQQPFPAPRPLPGRVWYLRSH